MWVITQIDRLTTWNEVIVPSAFMTADAEISMELLGDYGKDNPQKDGLFVVLRLYVSEDEYLIMRRNADAGIWLHDEYDPSLSPTGESTALEPLIPRTAVLTPDARTRYIAALQQRSVPVDVIGRIMAFSGDREGLTEKLVQESTFVAFRDRQNDDIRTV